MRGALVLLVTGCSFQGTSSELADAATDTTMIDGSPDGPSGFCLGDTSVTACLSEMPTQTLMINAPTTINTDNPGECAPNASSPAYCILAGSSIMIMGSATLSAAGTRPLVLMSSGGITIAPGAAIDVGGHRNAMPQLTGAGGRTCEGGIAPTPDGGAFGGTFGSIGGDGGADAGAHPGGKAASTTITTTSLQGGCAGEAGLNNGGTAGPAGGAVALLAVATIELDGTIFAGGGGAGGAKTNNRGGGGGGAGGMIVIDAPVITGTKPNIGANGGAGGEGSGGMMGKDGADAPADPTKVAAGGTGGSTGGDGGAGATSAGAAVAGGIGTSAAGGGGGGGGVGVIKVYGAAGLPGNVSPPPT